MGKIADYPCPANREAGILEAAEWSADFRFPEIYKKGEDMAKISRAVRNFCNESFCILPFCNTVEGEAMGGMVEYGSGSAGPRAKGYVCIEPCQVLQLSPIDFQSGRISEVLKACRILCKQGEIVALKTAGPFTILNVLADSAVVLKWVRKEPDLMKQILDKIRAELLRYIQEACKVGVRIISYADPVGGIRIIGPRQTEWITEQFTIPFLKEAMEVLPKDALIHLCPKITSVLIGLEKAKWIKQKTHQNAISYGESCIHLAGISKLAGQTCINDRTWIVEDVVYTIELVE